MTMILRSGRDMINSFIRGSMKKRVCLAFVALILWGAGFGCFICCASAAAAAACCASDESILTRQAFAVPAASQESCPERSCCKQPVKSRGNETLSKLVDVKPCCLHNSKAGPAALPKPVDDRAFAPKIIERPIAIEIDLQFRPLTLHAPVSNRGSTYLRCCVLLI